MRHEQADVVILGSGGAALVVACAAADAGLDVAVLEVADVFGGTTAVSGGMLWIGNNGLSPQIGIDDSRAETLTYLRRVTRGEVDRSYLEAFADSGPELVAYLTAQTPVRLFPIDRPDYNAHWPGGKIGGRVLDNRPFDTSQYPGLDALVRKAPHFPPLTYDERHRWRWPERFDTDLIDTRVATGVRTLGGALVAGLVAAARSKGVRLLSGVRGVDLLIDRDGGVDGVRATASGDDQTWRAGRSVVVANGGFEWDPDATRTFLRGPATASISPPWNVGDALWMLMRAGAALANMSEAWWAPAFQVPGESYDGRPMSRHLVDELSLPGSILVNRSGRRFGNESTNYNDLSKLFHHFDPHTYEYPNTPAWMIFDHRYKSRYATATIRSGTQAPPWFNPAASLDELAASISVDREGLARTVARFNDDARDGVDRQFGRGERHLDLYYGDDTHTPSPCLAPIEAPPFYAIEVLPGLLGTKGGARTDPDGRVIGTDGRIIPRLYACGNAAASTMGPGYPGAGGSLGPLLTHGFRCGQAIGAAARRAQR